MDQIEAMRVFTRVIERRSFAHAGRDLLLSRSKVSAAVRQLESRLGSPLLQRSTRQVVPTHEGELYHVRCLAILADLDDAEAELSTAQPGGPLRIDVSGDVARHYLIPKLSDFLVRYPKIKLHISEGDRLVDLMREGIDCVIRVGQLFDNRLVARRLAMLEECTLASPRYLGEHGTPETLSDLEGHRMIGFVSSATGAVLPLEFQTESGLRHVRLPVAITVSSSFMNVALAREGFGLIQVPRYRYVDDITRGSLIEVLPQHPPSPSPVSILFPEGRQLSARVRVFVDWAAQQFAR